MREFLLLSAFWKWWSNPLIGLHHDHTWMVPDDLSIDHPMAFHRLVELRKRFGLADTPCKFAIGNDAIVALAFVTPEIISERLYPVVAITLDESVLQCRYAEWRQKYGVKSSNQARDIIKTWTHLSNPLRLWQTECAEYFQQFQEFPISLHDRVNIALGVCLKSISPSYFARWRWLLDARVLGHISHFPVCGEVNGSYLRGWVLDTLKPLLPDVEQALGLDEFEEHLHAAEEN